MSWGDLSSHLTSSLHIDLQLLADSAERASHAWTFETERALIPPVLMKAESCW